MDQLEKSDIRRNVRATYRRTATEELSRQSVDVCSRLEQHPRFQEAQTVLLYHPLPDEVDICPVLRDYCQSKTLLLPVVVSEGEGCSMILRRYRGEDALVEGAFGIFEPSGDNAFRPSTINRIDLCVVPGVAFDVRGDRLGRGRGYYDRFFAANSPSAVGYKLGICFSYQLFFDIPTTVYDVRMDEVIAGRVTMSVNSSLAAQNR